MRLMKPALSLALTVAAASAVVASCSKDKDDDDDDPAPTVVTDAQKADANKASIAAVDSLSNIFGSDNGSGLLSHEQRLQIRTLYRQAVSNRRFMQDEGDVGGADFDFCALFTSACEQFKNNPPSLDETGTSTCTVTCPADSSLAMACTLESTSFQCKDTTYTMSAAKADMTMGCTKATDGKVTLGVNMKFSGNVAGGAITTATALVCSFDYSQDMAASEASSEGDDTDIDCTKFSCTLGGNALSCDDLKKSMTEKECG
jgi:hypothetical protein